MFPAIVTIMAINKRDMSYFFRLVMKMYSLFYFNYRIFAENEVHLLETIACKEVV
jgi:hypothetical protein